MDFFVWHYKNIERQQACFGCYKELPVLKFFVLEKAGIPSWQEVSWPFYILWRLIKNPKKERGLS